MRLTGHEEGEPGTWLHSNVARLFHAETGDGDDHVVNMTKLFGVVLANFHLLCIDE
jgi:hypothetical protein